MNTNDVITKATDAQVLIEVLTILGGREHEYDCPRIQDDYDCTCGRDALIFRVEQMYDKALGGVCPECHGKSGVLPNGVTFCNCPLADNY